MSEDGFHEDDTSADNAEAGFEDGLEDREGLVVCAVGVEENNHGCGGVVEDGAETGDVDDADEGAEAEDEGEDDFPAEGDVEAPDCGHGEDEDEDVGSEERTVSWLSPLSLE